MCLRKIKCSKFRFPGQNTKLDFLAVGCDYFCAGPCRGGQGLVPGGGVGPDILCVLFSLTRTFSLSFRIIQFEDVTGNLQTIGSALPTEIPLEILFYHDPGYPHNLLIF